MNRMTLKGEDYVSSSSTFQKVKPFIIGGLAGMFATCCVQPIDTIKVQIQILNE